MQTRLDAGDGTARYLKVPRTFYKPWFGSPRVLELLHDYGVDISEYRVSTYSKSAEMNALEPFCKIPDENVDEKLLAGVFRCFDKFFPSATLDDKVSFGKAVKSVSLLKGVGHGESNSCKNRQEALEKYLWWYKMCIENEWIKPLVKLDREYWSVETFARVMMKEEVRELTKILKGDVRAIMPCAMLLYLVENMLFEPIGAHMANQGRFYYRFNSRYCGGHRRFIHSLRKYSLDGDVRKFDKSSTARLSGNWFRWQKKFLKKAYFRLLMDWVLSQLLFSPLVTQDGEIIERVRGLISGMFGTTHNGTGCVGILICYTLLWNLVHTFGMTVEEAIDDVSNEKTFMWKNTGDNVIISSDDLEKLTKLEFDKPFADWSMQFKKGKVVLSHPPKGERGGPEFLGDLTFHHPTFGYLPYPSNAKKIIASMGLQTQHPGHPVLDLLRIKGVIRGAYWSDEIRRVGEKLLEDLSNIHSVWIERDIVHVSGGQPITIETVKREDLSYPTIVSLYTGLESKSQVASNKSLVLKEQDEHMGDLSETLLNWGLGKIGKILPTYGNWGGPGTDVREAGPPVDELDKAFQEHDYGYEMHERKLADRVVARRIEDLQRQGLLRGKYASAYAKMAKAYFKFTGGGEASDAEIAELDRKIQPVVRKHMPVLKNGSDLDTVHQEHQNSVQGNQTHQVKEALRFGVEGKDHFANTTMAPIRGRKGKGNKPGPGKSHKGPKGPGPKFGPGNRKGARKFRAQQGRFQTAPAQQYIPDGHSGSHIKKVGRGYMIYHVKERVVDYTITEVTLASGDILVNVKFNPANFKNCLRMHAQAKLWARYRVLDLKAKIIPSQTNSAVGNWECYWDPDPNDNPENIPADQRINVATAHKGSKAGIWWGNKEYHIPAPVKPDNFYVDPNEDEVLFNTSHRLVVIAGASAGLTDNSTLFSLFIEGDIFFWDETIEPAFANFQGQDIHIDGATTMTAANPLGSSPTKQGGSLSLDVVNNRTLVPAYGKVYYYPNTAASELAIGSGPTTQRYAVLAQSVGTGISAMTWTPSGSHSQVTAGASYIASDQKSGAVVMIIAVSSTGGALSANHLDLVYTATTVTSTIVRIMPLSIDVNKPKVPKSPIGKMIQQQVQRELEKILHRQAEEKDEKSFVTVTEESYEPIRGSRAQFGIPEGIVRSSAANYRGVSSTKAA